MVIACAVGRKAAAGGRELALDGFFHHGELDAGLVAHGVATADALHGTELAQAGHIRVKKPDARRAAHGEDSLFGAENVELAGAHVHGAGARAMLFAVPGGGEQCGGFGAVKHFHAEAQKRLEKSGLKGAAPDVQSEFVFIIVGEHQLRFVIAELCALEFIVGVADFAAERLKV